MTAIVILFVIFAIGFPLLLEEKRHPGDNILIRSAKELRESRQVVAATGWLTDKVMAVFMVALCILGFLAFWRILIFLFHRKW